MATAPDRARGGVCVALRICALPCVPTTTAVSRDTVALAISVETTGLAGRKFSCDMPARSPDAVVDALRDRQSRVVKGHRGHNDIRLESARVAAETISVAWSARD